METVEERNKTGREGGNKGRGKQRNEESEE